MLLDDAMIRDLIKIAADKFAIGLLIVGAGYLLNRLLEKYKAAQALSSELSKQRFAASLQRLDRQLSEFYWPLYLRLQKDNIVWARLLHKGRAEEDPLSRIAGKIESDFILPNHNEMVKIIETKMHLAEPSTELQGALLRYIDHVAVYNAAVAAGFRDLHSTERELLTPWPSDLFPLVEARTLDLQRQYLKSLDTLKQS